LLNINCNLILFFKRHFYYIGVSLILQHFCSSHFEGLIWEVDLYSFNNILIINKLFRCRQKKALTFDKYDDK